MRGAPPPLLSAFATWCFFKRSVALPLFLLYLLKPVTSLLTDHNNMSPFCVLSSGVIAALSVDRPEVFIRQRFSASDCRAVPCSMQ